MRKIFGLFGLLVVAKVGWAHPKNCEIRAGEVVLNSVSEKILEIAASDRSIIDWQEFSIQKGETTRFLLPHPSAKVLNRVLEPNVSEIYGSLESNGKLFLINPFGILVGEGGIVDARGGFFASTLLMSDAQFLGSEEALLFSGSSKASVVNRGEITSLSGDIALIGLEVSNEGAIAAPMGTVGLAAGEKILIQPDKAQKIFIAADLPANASLSQRGKIYALTVELQSSGNPYGKAFRCEGEIEARPVRDGQTGKIFLAAPKGALSVAGKLTAKEGSISAEAPEIAIEEQALLNVSGSSSAGSIQIGRTFKTRSVEIAEGAALQADSLGAVAGKGGSISIQSRGRISFSGQAYARGGMEGEGGKVSLSGCAQLDLSGKVDTRAPSGTSGTLVLKPDEARISKNAGHLHPETLSRLLSTTHLDLRGNKGNATLGSDLVWDSPHTLTVSAKGDAVFLANVRNVQNGSIRILADRDIYIGFENRDHASLAASQDVAIGSASGATQLIAKRHIYIGSENSSFPTQIGYNHSQNVTGPLALACGSKNTPGDLVLTAGNSPRARAQIGSGTGAAAIDASISIDAHGDVILRGPSRDGGFAQIGHGGMETETASLSGNISVAAASGIVLKGAAWMGHGDPTRSPEAQAAAIQGSLQIQTQGDISAQGGSTIFSSGPSRQEIRSSNGTIALQAADAPARFFHEGDEQFIFAEKGIFLWGSNQPNARGAEAAIFLASRNPQGASSQKIISNGPIELHGGAGEASSARIAFTPFKTVAGLQEIQSSSHLFVQGGTGRSACASISSAAGQIAAAAADIRVFAGDGEGAHASLEACQSLASSHSLIAGQNIVFRGGTGSGMANAYLLNGNVSLLENGATFNETVLIAKGNIFFQNGLNPSGQGALIHTRGPSRGTPLPLTEEAQDEHDFLLYRYAQYVQKGGTLPFWKGEQNWLETIGLAQEYAAYLAGQGTLPFLDPTAASLPTGWYVNVYLPQPALQPNSGPSFSGAGLIAQAGGDISIGCDLRAGALNKIRFTAGLNGLGALKIDTSPHDRLGRIAGTPSRGVRIRTLFGEQIIETKDRFADARPADYHLSHSADLSLYRTLGLQPSHISSRRGLVSVDPFRDVYVTGPLATEGILELEANNNMVFGEQARVKSGSATLVVDEQGQNGAIGGLWDPLGGRLIIDPSAQILSTSSIQMYTAARLLNSIQGTFLAQDQTGQNPIPQEQTFVPGSPYVDSGTEQWGTFFNRLVLLGAASDSSLSSGSSSSFYTIYYKEPIPFTPTILHNATISTADVFYLLSDLNERIPYWQIAFSMQVKDRPQTLIPHFINKRDYGDLNNPKMVNLWRWEPPEKLP